MPSLNDILPATEIIVYVYASISTVFMAFRIIQYLYEMIPEKLRNFVASKLAYLYEIFHSSSSFTFVIEPSWETMNNETYRAAQIYLLRSIGYSNGILLMGSNDTCDLTSPPKVALPVGAKFIHYFMNGMRLEWTLHSKEVKKNLYDRKYFSLTCEKQDKHKVLELYFPYITGMARYLILSKREKLYISSYDRKVGTWESSIFNHQSTFKTLAIKEELKESIVEDLRLFASGEVFFHRFCRVWKRSYLIYGQSGTGKTSLVAAIANHLRYNIYYVQFENVRNDAELRHMLTSTTKRSIILFEHVEYCSAMISRGHRQGQGGRVSKMLKNSGATLSGLLNFVDGLWSTCAEERIIVFTINEKDKLDPALLRPGRMDFHVELGYCTPELFKMLAYTCLNLKQHDYFKFIEDLIQEVKVTPAEVTQQLMKYDSAGIALEHLHEFLYIKKELQNPGDN